jgi:hypothetical protein
MARVTRYITVDIVVKTNGHCDSIAQAFKESAGYFVQKHEWTDHKWYLNISGGGAGDASAAIEKHCRYIAALKRNGMRPSSRNSSSDTMVEKLPVVLTAIFQPRESPWRRSWGQVSESQFIQQSKNDINKRIDRNRQSPSIILSVLLKQHDDIATTIYHWRLCGHLWLLEIASGLQ